MSKKRKLDSDFATSTIGGLLSKLDISDPNVLCEALSYSRMIGMKLPAVVSGNVKDAICVILASIKLLNPVSIGEIQRVCDVNEKQFKDQFRVCKSALQIDADRGSMIDKLSVHYNISDVKSDCTQLLLDYQKNVIDKMHVSQRNLINVEDDVYHAVAFWIILQERKITSGKNISDVIKKSGAGKKMFHSIYLTMKGCRDLTNENSQNLRDDCRSAFSSSAIDSSHRRNSRLESIKASIGIKSEKVSRPEVENIQTRNSASKSSMPADSADNTYSTLRMEYDQSSSLRENSPTIKKENIAVDIPTNFAEERGKKHIEMDQLKLRKKQEAELQLIVKRNHYLDWKKNISIIASIKQKCATVQ